MRKENDYGIIVFRALTDYIEKEVTGLWVANSIPGMFGSSNTCRALFISLTFRRAVNPVSVIA